jgi:protein-tyrosine phosphatase
VIDLHCHILPGVDDGPETMAESLAMCRTAASDGIRTIVATPHYRTGCFTWSEADQHSSIAALQSEIDAAGLPVSILPGAEIAFCPELPGLLKNSVHLTINRSGYFLIEFRPQAVPAAIEQFLVTLLDAGYLPIIAHPERNSWFTHHHDVLTSLVRRGALLQITASSLFGGFGADVRAFSQQLLRNNLVQIIASDAHNCSDRPTLLSAAVNIAADLIGVEQAVALVTTNPLAVINGTRLQPPEIAGYIAPEYSARPSTWFRRLLGFSE